METDRPLHNLPLLFEEVGKFFNRLMAMQEKWPESRKDVEGLFVRESGSAVDVAVDQYKKILEQLYDARLQGCSGTSTKMGR